MIITLLGSSGTVPLKNRPLTSLFVRYDRGAVLVDCGEGTQVEMANAKKKLLDLSVICITHQHADHVLGLPGLLVTLNQILVEVKKKKKIIIIAPGAAKKVITNLLSVAPLHNLYFEIIWMLHSDVTVEVPGLTIRAQRLDHTVHCYGYRIEQLHHGKFSHERAYACGMRPEQWTILQSGYTMLTERGRYTAEDLSNYNDRIESICYVTDTSLCKGVYSLAKGVDLAILEGMFSQERREAKGNAVKHLSLNEAAEVAKASEAGELWLTHFSPELSSPEDYLQTLTKIFPNVKCGYSGLQIEGVGKSV